MNKLIPANNHIVSLKKPVIGISREEVDKLKEAINKLSSSRTLTEKRYYAYERDKLLIEFIFQTGMRVSDALNVRYRDINTKDETITFQIKKRSKNKPFIHTISISKEILFEVLRFKDIKKSDINDRVFNITRGRVDQSLKEYCNAAGLPKYSAHKFRHGKALEDMNKGLPDWITAFTLGHSSTSVTNEIYRRPDHRIEKKIREMVK